MNIVGDALVAKLDNDNDKGMMLDLNGNDTEPFNEQISKDVAFAVAMIVAEHEIVKAKQREEDLKKKKALKLALAAKEKEASGTSSPQKIEIGKKKSREVLQQYHRSKTNIEKGLGHTNSNLANNNVPSSAAPPTPVGNHKEVSHVLSEFHKTKLDTLPVIGCYCCLLCLSSVITVLFSFNAMTFLTTVFTTLDVKVYLCKGTKCTCHSMTMRFRFSLLSLHKQFLNMLPYYFTC